MSALIRYLSFEMIAIHLLTGALFGVINGVLLAVVLERNAWFVPALVPVAAFSWWGWYAEGKFVVRAATDLRRGSGRI